MYQKKVYSNMGPQRKKNLPHSLPPIPTSASLSVTLSNRQSLIPGSPAPMAMKEEANLNRKKGGPRDIPPSPTITLSQYWDDDDGVSDDGGGSNGRSGSWGSNFHDSVIEVNSVGGNSHRSSKSAAKLSKRPSTSWSALSASNLAEVHKSVLERNTASGVLNPPPRVISIQDGHGHSVMTEFIQPLALPSKIPEPQAADGISSKYSPLKPIQKKGREVKKK